MDRCRSHSGLIRWTLALSCMHAAAWIAAAESETRNYNVAIDGKKAGTYQLTIESQPDGAVRATSAADVRVSYIVYAYKYTFRGTEVWKAGRLVQLESQSNDNGKHFKLKAAANKDRLNVQANGALKSMPGDAWPTTYWRLPDAEIRGRALTLLDADTGKELQGRLQKMGSASVRVAGQDVDCTHYRLSGGVTADLYYDGLDRMVRQETVEDGHRTVIELIAVRNNQ